MPLTIVYSASPDRLASIELDSISSKTHSADVDVTEHEVEEGANIADHAKPKPETLKFEGRVSDGPLKRDTAFAVQKGRARDTLAALRKLKDESQVVAITHNGRTYERMVLTNLEEPESGKSSDGSGVSLAFKQIRTVRTQTVAIVVRTKVPKAKPEDKGGTQNGSPAPAPVRERSVWKKLFSSDETGPKATPGSNIFGKLTKVTGIAGGA